MPAEVVLLIFGILAALVGLENYPDAKKKPKVIFVLFLAGIAIQLMTQAFQYYNVTLAKEQARIDSERRLAQVIWAFAQENAEILPKYAKDEFYIRGYRAWQDGERDKAKLFFEKSIEGERFEAASLYLLAVLERTAKGSRKEIVRGYLDDALERDPKYAAAYYLRAILRLEEKEPMKSVTEDLRKSVDEAVGSCYELFRPAEIDTSLRGVPPHNLEDLRARCVNLYGIPRQSFEPQVKAIDTVSSDSHFP